MIKLKHLLPEGQCNECGRDWNHGHDHEAGMAKNELRDAISNASKIDQMIGEGDNLPGWVSAYISLAADYMHSVAEYLGGESSRAEEPGPGYDMIGEEIDPEEAWNKLDRTEKAKILKKLIYGIENSPIYNSLAAGMATLDNLSPKNKHRVYNYLRRSVMNEANKKPSAGLTKKEKSDVVKKAHAGKDIGKKGPGFEKVAKAAEKKYGSKEAGEKVAAAAMWKNIKRK